MRIDASFPGGRIAVVSADDPSDVRLSIPPDPGDARFRQWFCFRVCGAEGVPCGFTLVDAGECTWKRGFVGYRVMASEDGEAWFRVPTRYDGETLRFDYTPSSDRVTFAYFTPYDVARAEALAARAAASALVEVSTIATTPAGVRVPVLAFGERRAGARQVWVIAAQHPGEPQASWFAEGLVARLGAGDAAARALLARAQVHVVPLMNPDGCALGNHRTNAAGLDLNRQWLEPDPAAPEVAGVRAAMVASGCDLFLDIHGDETIPHVFAQGTEGVPGRGLRVVGLERRFAAAMTRAAAPDFQTVHGYPKTRPGDANLRIAANWAAATFQCLSITLEMPFTDHLDAPDPERGWTPERSARLGSAAVEALAACVEHLRAP